MAGPRLMTVAQRVFRQKSILLRQRLTIGVIELKKPGVFACAAFDEN
jgi:hypothetical protein